MNRSISHLGVEEEFHLVDAQTRRLSTGAGELLAALGGDDDRFKPELLDSAIEVNSAVHPTLADLRADLVSSRRQLATAAEKLGLGLVSAGTAPLASPSETRIVPGARNDRMREAYRMLVDDQMICGAQVHVDIPDRDLGIASLGRIVPWLPVLLAISASSPFWCGRDTGYASFRTLVWQRWPTAGLPPDVSGEEEYDRMVTGLLETGTILDAGMIYFDARPSAHVPTLEVRLCDAIPHVDDVMLIAALVRALVQQVTDDIRAGLPASELPRPVMEAARWRAARTGLDGDLLHPLTGRPVPAPVALAALIDYTRDTLDEAGDLETVARLATRAVRGGGNAGRQRRLFAQTGTLESVVDLLLADTLDDPLPSEE